MAYTLPKGQPELNAVIAKNITRVMTAKNKTHEALALAIGVDRVTVTRYCNGQRQIPTVLLCKIARFLSVSTDYLLGIHNSPSVDSNVAEVCDALGISDDAFFNLHRHMGGKMNGAAASIIEKLVDGGDLGQSIDFADWNNAEIDDYTIADLMNLALTTEDFYNLLKAICDARNSLAGAANADGRDMDEQYAEAEKQLFRCYRIMGKLRENLFSPLEEEAERALMRMPEEIDDGNCD